MIWYSGITTITAFFKYLMLQETLQGEELDEIIKVAEDLDKLKVAS